MVMVAVNYDGTDCAVVYRCLKCPQNPIDDDLGSMAAIPGRSVSSRSLTAYFRRKSHPRLNSSPTWRVR